MAAQTGEMMLPAATSRISRPHRHTAVLPMDRQGKIRFSLPTSARGSSIEQLLADGLTKRKGADIFALVSGGHRSDRIPPRESPRGAHDTLQPPDESVIVGYYTSAEVLSCGYRNKNK